MLLRGSAAILPEYPRLYGNHEKSFTGEGFDDVGAWLVISPQEIYAWWAVQPAARGTYYSTERELLRGSIGSANGDWWVGHYSLTPEELEILLARAGKLPQRSRPDCKLVRVSLQELRHALDGE